jgi:Uri superfamily endonuclease
MTRPATGGTYILLVELDSPATVTIGRLGQIPFVEGVYAYVGSALGPGGLGARIGRYTCGPKNKHWHIDFLLEHGETLGVLTRQGVRRRECDWSSWIGARALDCVSGFGSSDCRCEGHLYFVGDRNKKEDFVTAAGCELKATMEVDNGL